MALNDFCLRLSVLPPKAIQALVNTYLDSYAGEDEHLWPVFSVLSKSMGLPYARQRFAHLLSVAKETGDFTGIQRSCCLSNMESVLQTSHKVQKDLLEFLQTIEITDKNIEDIERVVDYFADDMCRTRWSEQREHYLVHRLVTIMRGGDAQRIAHLKGLLIRYPEWHFFTIARPAIIDCLRRFKLNAWTIAQHLLVNSLEDTELKEIYYTRLLKRILLKRDFAEEYALYLPKEEDVVARFMLMNAPQFRGVCETALQHLEKQPFIDHVEAIRIFDSLLHDGVAQSLELDDLRKRADAVVLKFKNQLHVDRLAEEVVSLIDEDYRDQAIAKIQYLCDVYHYYDALDVVKEKERVTETLQRIITAIDERWHLPLDNRKRLGIDQVIKLVKPMENIPVAEPLMWHLAHFEKLPTIVTRIKTEITTVSLGKAETIPSLGVFVEGLRRGLISLSSQKKESLVKRLQGVEESANYDVLSLVAKDSIANLLRYLRGELALQALADTVSAKASTTQTIALQDCRQEKPKHAEPLSIPYDEIIDVDSRAIINDLQSTKTYEKAIALLGNVRSQGNEDKQKHVFDELQRYFCKAYRTYRGVRDEKHIYAGNQLHALKHMVTRLKLQPTHPFILLALHFRRIQQQALDFTLSLKHIVEQKKQEIPELNQILIIAITQGLISRKTQQKWVGDLSTVLPVIYQSSLGNDLKEALRAFLKILKGEESKEDRQTIVFYENRYRKRSKENASVIQTDKLRIIQPASVTHAAVDRAVQQTNSGESPAVTTGS